MRLVHWGKREISMKGVLLLLLFYGFISLSLRISIAADTIAAHQSISDGETLVSPGQTFELGFFSPNKSKNRYLGIWYKNISSTIVWVANRNKPIIDPSGILTIGLDGNIIVLNGSNNIIWSSGSSRSLEKPVAQLLDSGNLVLKDLMFGDSDNYLWQSFDYPSDTVIPGMKYGWDLRIGLNRYLTSWKNIDDPSLGEFRSSIDLTGIPQQVVRNGSNIVFRSGAMDGVQFTGSFFISNQVLKGTYVSNADEVYYMNMPNTSVLSRFTMSPWGKLQRFRWDNISLDWAIMFEMPGDQCDKYMYCGVNAVCNSNIAPACGCLQGFIPKSQHEWDVLNWAGGCVRRTPLSCGSGDRFIPIIQVKLPDMVHFLVNKSLGVKECEVECLNNCSCMAYANLNRYSGCIFWFEELFDVRHLIGDGEQNLYIRLAGSELDICDDCVEPISNSNKKKRRDVMAISLSGGLAMLLLGLIIWFFIWKKMWRNKGGNVESQKEELELPLFDLMTIVVATDNFCPTNKIGQGGFGPVYKGRLADGQEIAVKKLSKDSGQGLIEFKNEVILIAKLQHRNLVKLLGCCIQGEEKMLVYEYMPNESLDYFIFDQKRSKLLTWQKRLSIIMGIARGLLYLHQDSRLRIVHRDLKASNILLDSNMNPKVSDFGIARIFRGDQTEANTKKVIGGYMSPEYVIDGQFSVKLDVFSFGVLVLEIVSAKKNRGFHHENHHHNLLGHAWLLWKAGKALELIDTSLGDSFSVSEVMRCIQVSLLCVQQLPADRPNMSSVVFMLGSESALLPEPKQPGFFIERSSLGGIMDGMTSNLVTISLLEAR